MKDKSLKGKSKEKRDNMKAIDNWKAEISKKGEKARDLSDFILKDHKSFN